MANLPRAITDPFQRFFRDKREEESQVEAEQLRLAHEALAWAEMPYYKTYIAALDREIAKPIDISGSDRAVLQNAVRANTIREIRDDLTTRVRQAEQVIANSREM